MLVEHTKRPLCVYKGIKLAALEEEQVHKNSEVVDY